MTILLRSLAVLVTCVSFHGIALALQAGATNTCLVMPSQEVNVGSPADGIIDYVAVDRGDLVSAGQTLARLNTGVETAQIATGEAKTEFGQRKLKRNEELFKKNLISSHELDEMNTEKELSRLELQERKESLKLRSVLSPFRGVVVDRFKNKGDLVRQEKVFRLAQIDPLYVEAVVAAELFGRIKLGQSFDVEMPLLKQRHKAKVTTLDRVIDPASGTFRVRLSLSNPSGDIPSGVRCVVNF